MSTARTQIYSFVEKLVEEIETIERSQVDRAVSITTREQAVMTAENTVTQRAYTLKNREEAVAQVSKIASERGAKIKTLEEANEKMLADKRKAEAELREFKTRFDAQEVVLGQKLSLIAELRRQIDELQPNVKSVAVAGA